MNDRVRKTELAEALRILLPLAERGLRSYPTDESLIAFRQAEKTLLRWIQAGDGVGLYLLNGKLPRSPSFPTGYFVETESKEDKLLRLLVATQWPTLEP